MSEKCRKCGEPVVWIKTPKGSWMICNDKKFTVVTKEGNVVNGLEPHWATCPFAAEFRKKGA